MKDFLTEFLLDLGSECFAFMLESLTNYEVFSAKLSERLKVKDGGNEQFSFDVELDDLVKQNLERNNITGWVFSEERGVYDIPGERKYRVVYDPFCNSSLASRTFREGALGISIFSYDYRFLASGILDFQTGLVAIANEEETRFYQVQTRSRVSIDRPGVVNLEDAWVVLTLEDRDERSHLKDGDRLLRQANRIINSSGHIYWLRLAAGFVDVYTDPFGGEQLYEMFACTVALGSGCRVTNLEGEAFDAGKYLRIFEQEPKHRFYPVAARTEELHSKVLQGLSRQSAR